MFAYIVSKVLWMAGMAIVFAVKTVALGIFLSIGIDIGKEVMVKYRNWRTDHNPIYSPSASVEKNGKWTPVTARLLGI